MAHRLDRNRCLNELEGLDWGEPTYHSSLVITCHALRRKPLNQFTAEDLRIMIGQNISLPYLLPLALEALEANPIVEGRFYPGDLLAAVLGVDDAFWRQRPDLFQRATSILARVKELMPALDEVTGASVQDVFKQAPRIFRRFLS